MLCTGTTCFVLIGVRHQVLIWPRGLLTTNLIQPVNHRLVDLGLQVLKQPCDRVLILHGIEAPRFEFGIVNYEMSVQETKHNKIKKISQKYEVYS